MIHTGSDTVGGVLLAAVARHPDRPFLLFEDAPGQVTELSYADIGQRARDTAHRLQSLGVRPGDRVHLHLANCPEFYSIWFGCALLGASIVPTNPDATAAELRFIIADAGCEHSFTAGSLAAVVAEARQELGQPGFVITVVGSHESARRLDEVDSAGALELPVVAATDPAAVLYTSGTTSRPKGVVITHANYLHVGEVVAAHLRLRPADRWLIVLPLFHANAQYYCTMSALVTGASIALAPRFSASGWARQAVGMQATVASMFAAPIRMLLASASQPEESNCRLRLTIFGQSLSPDQMADFERRFGTSLVQLYGMTETVAPPTFNPIFGGCRPETIGRPLPHSRLRVVDEAGDDVPVGSTGELLVHGVPGETIMAGYLNQPAVTAATMPGGWLHTGDVVRVDGDGYLTFVDRTKDMIKRSGENVAASEVEQVLNDHPAVFESAVVGVPDELRDEAIVAFVVLHEGASAEPALIQEWAAARLSRFKVPGTVHVIDALPRTSVGKVRKIELREGLTR